MKIFSIADLHLSFNSQKPMDVFGYEWKNHFLKIKDNWQKKVKEDDLVILPGDISWALRFQEADMDLLWIDRLNGKKVILKGNHDYWWTSLKKMQGKYKSIFFLHNNAYEYNDKLIVGTRGWLLKTNPAFEEKDSKIYSRELLRLEFSIKEALKISKKKEIIACIHYPPVMKNDYNNEFIDIFKKYKIKNVICGHLHDMQAWKNAIIGYFEGINYHLVSCDYLDFKLKNIL